MALGYHYDLSGSWILAIIFIVAFYWCLELQFMNQTLQIRTKHVFLNTFKSKKG